VLASERPEGLAGLVAMGNALTLTGPMRIPFRLWSRLGLRMPDAYLLKPTAGDVVDPAALEEFRRQAPRAETIVVDRAGHMVAGDRNDAFGDAITAFLERI